LLEIVVPAQHETINDPLDDRQTSR